MKKWRVTLPGNRHFEIESDTPHEDMAAQGFDAYGLMEITGMDIPPAVPRLRTAPGILQIIREEDPNTEVTLHFLRQLIKTGKVRSVPVGRKKLVNVDEVQAYLATVH